MHSDCQNNNVKTKRVPGEDGIWFFVFCDLFVFSMFFIVFLYYQGESPELFAEAQGHLNLGYGLTNTLLLLTSSWFVATAIHAARNGQSAITPWLFLATIMCGVGFGVIKFLEYSQKINDGITIITNDFFMFYFVLTAIHFLHVLIGMGFLTVTTLGNWSGGPYDEKAIRNMEVVAIFWHVVDLLWIVLFALLYLV